MFTRVDLPQNKRILLANLVLHTGWPVLVEILEQQCTEATAQAINADPEQDKKVLVLQARARCINEFCSYLRKQIQVNCDAAQVELQREAEEQLEAEVEAISGTQD